MFKKLIEALLDAGMTESQIGQKIGCHQSSVNRMRWGKQEPSFSTGDKLIRLHRAKCERHARKPKAEPGRASA